MLLTTGKIRIGHDCLDPDDKCRCIMEKAEIAEACKDAEEAIFGKEESDISKVGQQCQACGRKLKYLNEDPGHYQCTHCNCIWECLGVMDQRPIWVCTFDPSQLR